MNKRKRGEPAIDMGALVNKYRAVGKADKAKLTAKLALRAVGVKKPLFLGGYSDKLRKEQFEEDCLLAQKLQQTKKEPFIKPFKEYIKDSYLAIAVESMDRGGLEKVAALLALEWRKQGIPVRVLCMNKGGSIANELQKKGITVVEFKRDMDRLYSYLNREKPVLANTHFLQTGIPCFSRLHIPVVEVVHNMYCFMDSMTISRERGKHVLVDHYIAVSERAAECFLKKVPEVEKDRVSVIGNCFDVRVKLQHDRSWIRKELKADEDTFLFLSAGGIDSRKNTIGMIRAFDILQKLTSRKMMLVIAGGVSDHEYEKMVKDVLEERHLHNVYLLGQRNDMADLLSASDVFLLDSYCEGWSVAATEAVSCGIPIIHSDCGSGRELIAGGMNGILTDNPIHGIDDYDGVELWDIMHAGVNENLEQMVMAMQQMILQEADWKNSVDNRIKHAKEHFSSSKVANAYLTVFAKVLADQKKTIQTDTEQMNE